MMALRASFMGESEMLSAGIASRMALHNSRYRRGIKQQSYGDAPASGKTSFVNLPKFMIRGKYSVTFGDITLNFVKFR
jgi:hypothetical protein